MFRKPIHVDIRSSTYLLSTISANGSYFLFDNCFYAYYLEKYNLKLSNINNSFDLFPLSYDYIFRYENQFYIIRKQRFKKISIDYDFNLVDIAAIEVEKFNFRFKTKEQYDLFSKEYSKHKLRF